MSIFKSLKLDDVSRVSFNANKPFSLISSSASEINVNIETFAYITASLNTYSTTATDTSSSLKYHQLDHLFYKNYKSDLANRFGDANYLEGHRNLYNKVNILTIPSGLYGNKIKPGTFQFSGSLGFKSGSYVIKDDKKGNLIISGTNLVSHSIDERERVFFMGPIKGFKYYNLNADFYGKTFPKLDSYFNKENVNDDSYYSMS